MPAPAANRPAFPHRTIADCHDADITPGTIIPPWHGQRLDLDHAIYICLANTAARARQDREATSQDPDAQEVQQPPEHREDQKEHSEYVRPRVEAAVNPFDYFRDYYKRQARA